MAESTTHSKTAVHWFAEAPSLAELPAVIDVEVTQPPNPPEAIQTKFVGLSYESAYAEADSFVRVADEMARKWGVGGGGLGGASRVVDFGSGWGRISRTLLRQVKPTDLYCLDVDAEMTALVNTTLPGVNAMTVKPMPPTPLGDSTFDAVLAFSVFSHLSPAAHEAWAAEFGRITSTGAVVVITVLDELFFTQVRGAQKGVADGSADEFSSGLATVFADVDGAERAYESGEAQFAGTGGGEVRTGDFYGWAIAPPAYVQRVWGAAGFRIVEWVRSGVIVPQALVMMIREADDVVPDRKPVRVSAQVVSQESLLGRVRRLLGAARRSVRPSG